MYCIGCDIGGTKCAVSVGCENNSEIQILDRKEFATVPDWHEVTDRLFSLAAEMTKGIPVSACGFSCGGPLDSEKGIVMCPPNLPTWDNVPLTAMGRERLGVPCFLENDANACALAEWRWGAGKGAKNVVFLTFGTGLGAGLILDNRLIRGANGNAGEAGHIRLTAFGPSGYGKAGSFEGYCSGSGIAQIGILLAKEAVQNGITPAYLDEGLDKITTKKIAFAAKNGDVTAKKVFDLCGEKLGEGLSLLTDILNPDRIVIGSVFTRCEDLLRPEMERVMRRECLPCSYAAVKVVPAALGESIGDYAALCAADYGINQ